MGEQVGKTESSKSEVTVGIDPGIRGGAAYFENSKLVFLFEQPRISSGFRKSKTGRVREVFEPDLFEMYRLVSNWRQSALASGARFTAYIEKVSPVPGKRGVFGVGKLQYLCGLWEGLLTMAGARVVRIPSQKWQREVFGRTSSDKAASRKKAAELFKEWEGSFRRADEDGLAEAALIGFYGILESSGATSKRPRKKLTSTRLPRRNGRKFKAAAAKKMRRR